MRWAASSLACKVHFLMVCVDSNAFNSSAKFVEELGLEGIIIGYCADKNHFPPFPAQLGCQGLVVFDSDGHIVINRSSSLNEIGVFAFKEVDTYLTELLGCTEDVEVDREDRVFSTANDLRQYMLTRQASRCGGGKTVSKCAGACPTPLNQLERSMEDGSCSSSRHVPVTVPLTGHAEMDEEHAVISSAIELLHLHPTVEVLSNLAVTMKAHFEHEERLMIAAGFGKDGSLGLSPLASHVADHRKIIEYTKNALKVALDVRNISSDCAQSIANLFVTHANDFDSRYENYLACDV